MRKIIELLTFRNYLAFFSFTLCVFPKVAPLMIVGLGFFVYCEYKADKLTFHIHKSLLVLVLLYLIYLIGVIFTNNSILASAYVENKLSFVIFPLLFCCKMKRKYLLEGVIVGLIIGVFILSLLGAVNSMFLYFEGASFSASFYTIGFSYLHHPTYFSVYLLLAMVGCIHGYQMKWKYFPRSLANVLIVLFLTALYLCHSFSAFIFLFLVLFVAISFWIRRTFGRKALYVLIIGWLLASVVFVGWNLKTGTKDDNEIARAVASIKDYVASPTKFIHKYSKEEDPRNYRSGYKTGNEVRLILWTASCLEIMDHPFGVGTGNVDIALKSRLIKLNQEDMLEGEYNPHNQYLQTALEIGFQGLFILFLFLFLVVRHAFRHRKWLLLILIGSLIFNSLFESMLQRQSGIVFYSFWICLMVALPANNNDPELVKESNK